MLYDKVYIIPSYKCNLKCPHCDLKNIQTHENIDDVIGAINNSQSNEYILFGGEPFLNLEYIDKCCRTNKITSVTSNIITNINNIIFYVKSFDLRLSTSWNYNRFTDNQFKIWLNNLRILKENNISTTLLITATDDLILSNFHNFLNTLHTIDDIRCIDNVVIEPLIASSYTTSQDQLNDWYVKLNESWSFHFKNAFNYMSRFHDCSKIITILPDGSIKKGCPQFIRKNIISQCFDCENVSFCKPCDCLAQCRMPRNYIKLYPIY